LAIGVIVAQISKDLVDSLVAGLLMPLIKLIIPVQGVENLSFTVKGIVFNFGNILNNLLTFLIVLTILFIVIKKILKKDWMPKKR
jgi:large conductance mechanosensitive channel